MVFIRNIKNIYGDCMDLRNLNTFIQVAESGSFTKAGELLGYSQPTVSIQIKQLEDEFGAKLFDRIGHTVRLTDRGKEILVQAQQIFHLCSQMSHGGKGNDLKGHIRLAMADSMCAPIFGSRFSSFRQRWPNISLKVVSAGTDEMFYMLDHNEADIVCTLDSHIFNNNYVIAKEERVGVHFVAAASSLLAGKEKLSLMELAKEDFVLTEKGMSYRRLLDEAMAKQSLEIRPVFETGRAELICNLVEQGLGVSFLPDYITEEAVKKGSIVRLNVSEFEPELWKQLLYHREKWLSPQMEAVIKQLSDVM